MCFGLLDKKKDDSDGIDTDFELGNLNLGMPPF